jgi:hypothetical protein
LQPFAAACGFVVGGTMRVRADEFNDGEVKRRADGGNGVSVKP